MPPAFRSDRTWTFDVPPDRFWETVSRTDEFPRWFSWLRWLDDTGLVEGGRARCEVDPPLPYNLRFSIDLRRVVPARLVEADVDGDIAGPARLEIEPADGDGSRVRLFWELTPKSPLLRGLSRIGRPVMVWGHDRVLELGVNQFRRRALADGDAAP